MKIYKKISILLILLNSNLIYCDLNFQEDEQYELNDYNDYFDESNDDYSELSENNDYNSEIADDEYKNNNECNCPDCCKKNSGTTLGITLAGGAAGVGIGAAVKGGAGAAIGGPIGLVGGFGLAKMLGY